MVTPPRSEGSGSMGSQMLSAAKHDMAVLSVWMTHIMVHPYPPPHDAQYFQVDHPASFPWKHLVSKLEGISPENSEFSSASLSGTDIALPNSKKEGKLMVDEASSFESDGFEETEGRRLIPRPNRKIPRIHATRIRTATAKVPMQVITILVMLNCSIKVKRHLTARLLHRKRKVTLQIHLPTQRIGPP